MTTFTFERREHEEYGGFGWALQGSDFMEPLPGMTVAHDCLEHFANDDGYVHEEFKAFGSMLLIRGEGGYWHRMGSHVTDAGYHMSGDLGANLFYYWQNEAAEYMKPAPRTQKLDDELEEQITLAIQGATTELLSQEIERETIKRFLEHFRAWVRIGYRQAKKRFSNMSCPEELTDMFVRIQEGADEALRDEGYDTMKVVVNFKQREVEVIPTSRWDDEEWY